MSGLFTAFALAHPAQATTQSDLENGFAGALRGCEEWVLNPESWTNGLEGFPDSLGLGNTAGWAKSANESTLPPKKLRVANHYLRINSTRDAGYVLVVSDRIPFCHITGGGSTDLQPLVSAVLEGKDFRSHWVPVRDVTQGDMTSTVFRSLKDPGFEMTISRASKPGERLDRVQVLATAFYRPGG